MDKSIPAGAAMLLDFIGETEVGTSGPEGYGVIYAHKQGRLPKPLTSMTLGEVVDAQRGWSKNHGSSAAGRYQFMRATLQGLAKELGLKGTQKFDADFQDRLGFHLLKRRGYDDFMAGDLSVEQFGRNLAMEWASLPVLSYSKGAHRQVKRGQSYYAGDGLNKALVFPDDVEVVLAKVRRANASPKPADAPKPIPASKPAQPANARPDEDEGGLWARLIGWLAKKIIEAIPFIGK